MNYKIEVEIKESDIKKCIDKAGKFSKYELESRARSFIYRELDKRFRKELKTLNLDSLLSTALHSIDWSKLVQEAIESSVRADY